MKLDLTINSDKSYLAAQRKLSELYDSDHWLEVTIKTGSTRTNQQNRAMHKYFELLANALNEAGFDQRKVLAAMKEGVEIPNSQDSIKELWREIQKPMTGKESTAELERTEVDRIYNVLNRWTANTFGISMDFPSEDRGQ